MENPVFGETFSGEEPIGGKSPSGSTIELKQSALLVSALIEILIKISNYLNL